MVKPMPRVAPLHELALEGFCVHRRQKPRGDASAILAVEMSIPSFQRLIGLIPGVIEPFTPSRLAKDKEGAIRDLNLASWPWASQYKSWNNCSEDEIWGLRLEIPEMWGQVKAFAGY